MVMAIPPCHRGCFTPNSLLCSRVQNFSWCSRPLRGGNTQGNWDLFHGNVIATMVDNYDIVADITNIEDGFCVTLKSVYATAGYSDFLVQIDIRNKPDSCSYNAVLAHEDEHIRAYLSVMDDYKKEFMDALYSAADSITPIFVYNESDIDDAINELNAELQAHPDLILVKQKIKAAEEIRNKRVDQHDTGQSLQKCFE